MAQLTINIPDAQLNRVLDALAAVDPLIFPPPPPLTQPQKVVAARQRVAQFIKEVLARYERDIQIKALPAPTDPGLT